MDNSSVAQRLKEFIEQKGIPSSQFADMCDIPRPSLSQILTGRNKKINDVIVGQIHKAFPEMSVIWLLFGEGGMLIGQDGNSQSKSEKCPSNDKKNTTDSKGDEKKGKETGVNSTKNAPNTGNNQTIETVQQNIDLLRQIDKMKANQRKVVQITVYYDDSTFETFYPGRK